jgi:hypothetical protein
LTDADDPYGLTKGIAPLYEKPKKTMVHKSLTAMWWILELFPHSYYTRDDMSEEMRIPLGARRRLPADSLVHPSVMQRMQEKVCYRPHNVTMDELVLPAAPTPDNPEGFYVFKPTQCREGDWRENWFVVFVVSVLEIALGLFVLAWVLIGLGHVADWLLQLAPWLRHNVLPTDNLTWVSALYQRVSTFVLDLSSPLWLWVWHWFWALIVATVLVVVRFAIATVRRQQS